MAFTSELGTVDSTLGKETLVYALSQGTGTTFLREASNTVTFSQQARLPEIINLTASNTVNMSQSGRDQNVFRTASNSFSMTHTAGSGLISRTAANTVSFSQNAHPQQEFDVSASSAVAFTQTVNPGLLTRTAATPIEFAQDIRAGIGLADAIVLTASGSISFTQTAKKSIVFASATQLDASNSISFSQNAIFPIELTASNSMAFSQGADPSGLCASTSITFTQLATVNREFSLTATTNLKMNQSMVYNHLRNGEEVSFLCGITKDYNPRISDNPDGAPEPPRIVAPPKKRFTDFVWFFPSASQGSATNLVSLRTPNLGNRDRQAFDIINRESRGGTIQVFRDPDWPEMRTLVLDFSGLKETEAQDMLTFLALTAGNEVGLRDWNGRTWKGIIQTPEAPIIRTRNNAIDLALEVEVTGEILEMDVTTSITFNQSVVDAQVM